MTNMIYTANVASIGLLILTWIVTVLAITNQRRDASDTHLVLLPIIALILDGVSLLGIGGMRATVLGTDSAQSVLATLSNHHVISVFPFTSAAIFCCATIIAMRGCAPVSPASIVAFQPTNMDSDTPLSTGRYKSLVRSAPMGIFTGGLNGEFKRVNSAFLKLTGLKKKEILGEDWRQVFTPIKDTRQEREFAELLSGTRQKCRYETRMNRKGGRAIWVHVTLCKTGEKRWGQDGIAAYVHNITDLKNAEAESHKARSTLAAAQRISHIGVWEWDLPSDTFTFSRELCRILGIKPNKRNISLTKFLELIHLNDRETVHSKLKSSIDTAEPCVIEPRITLHDNNHKFVHMRGEVVHDSDGTPLKMKGVLQDVTALSEANLSLAKLSKAVEDSPSSVVITDSNGLIEYTNKAFSAITGYDRDELLGQSTSILGSGRQPREIYEQMWQIIRNGGIWRGEFENLKKNGETYWEMASISPILDESGAIISYVAVKEDITERKQLEKHLTYLSKHDSLTGLPNRYQLEKDLDIKLQTAREQKTSVAVMFIDLNGFKNINDSLGHEVGDKLLIMLGKAFMKNVKEIGSVYRFGGDEFIFTSSEIHDIDDSPPLVKRINEIVRAPIKVGDREFQLSASIGVSFYPENGRTVSELIKQADTAMFNAKDGADHTCFYHADMGSAVEERLAMESCLRQSVKDDEFSLQFQPQVETANGRVSGFEALLRWRSPLLGPVPPDKFIPISEDIGFIEEIDKWVLFQSCALFNAMKSVRGSGVNLGINVSGTSLGNGKLVDLVSAAIQKTSLDPSQIDIEITETALMRDPQNAINVMKRLKDIGVQLSIDDFGTGYSSYGYLKKFPIDTIKIDRSFISNINTDAKDEAITANIISLAHSLGIKSIAEGVETIVQRKILEKHGVDMIQGYLINKPLTFKQVETFMFKSKTKVSEPRPFVMH